MRSQHTHKLCFFFVKYGHCAKQSTVGYKASLTGFICSLNVCILCRKQTRNIYIANVLILHREGFPAISGDRHPIVRVFVDLTNKDCFGVTQTQQREHKSIVVKKANFSSTMRYFNRRKGYGIVVADKYIVVSRWNGHACANGFTGRKQEQRSIFRFQIVGFGLRSSVSNSLFSSGRIFTPTANFQRVFIAVLLTRKNVIACRCQGKRKGCVLLRNNGCSVLGIKPHIFLIAKYRSVCDAGHV